MGTIITIYLIVGFCVVFFTLAFKAAFYILLLPVMPFIIAYNNWKIKPIQARIIVVLWGVLYLLIILLCIFDK